MPTPSNGYAIATISALKAIANTDRTNGYSRLVLSINAWYTFNSASTATGDDNDVVVPADNPASGRWLKTAASLGGAIASSQKGAANGVATLDQNALIPDSQISSAITRDTELQAGLETKIASSQKGAANGVSSLDSNAIIPITQIPLILPVATTIDYEGAILSSGILNENGLIWLLLDGATIGNAASGATRYANAKAQTLFEKLWNNPNLAIFTSTGASSTKGTTALEDFTANKRLALPDARGRSILSAGTASGLTARTWGQIGGAETHTLSTSQIPAHTHGLSEFKYTSGGANVIKILIDGTGPGIAQQSDPTGGGSAHNNMQPFYVSSGKLILAGKA